MAVSSLNGKKKTESESEDEFSDEEDEDSSFNEDMEAIRKACMLTGTNPNEFTGTAITTTNTTTTLSVSDSDSEGGSEIDDVELVRQIQERFNLEPICLKPLNTLPPVGDDDYSDEDDDDDDSADLATLRAIERRFGTYESSFVQENIKSRSEPDVQQGTSTTFGQETSYSLPKRKDSDSVGQVLQFSEEVVPGSEEAYNSSIPLSYSDEGPSDQPLGSTLWNQPEASDFDQPEASESPSKYSRFHNPKSAYIFIDAIRKNRAFQKLIRNKLIQIEARIEENRKLKERIKLLKDFQLSCKRRAGRALSQKKDARIQLISTCKVRKTTSLKVTDKRVHALGFGPVENSHVANYRMVMQRYPPSRRERWSPAESENLGKGIKQQFQEMLLQRSLELYSDSNISSGDSNTFEDIIASISEFDIPPEKIRSFLPKVDWERLASLFVEGRSGAECEARWRNHEDPLINHNKWTNFEDKKLLYIIEKQQSIQKWLDISSNLGTNRTPFQCLARYQRSLNSNILKSDWTEDDDAQLRAAVEAFGENDWQLVASHMEARTGTQCSNRWMKTLNPVRERAGRWTVEEDKHLKVAMMLFGAKTWNKVEQFVPGRTQVQCRERWLNVLDPSINLKPWTKDEDSRLKAAHLEHGHCWSKVAEAVPNRTDNQCRRRWKVLFRDEVPKRQAELRIQKAAIQSNFVGRAEDRPALGPSDFLPLPGTCALTEGENGNNVKKKKKKEGRKLASKKPKDPCRWKLASKKPKDVAIEGDAVPRKKDERSRRSKRLSNKELPSYAQMAQSSSIEDSDAEEDMAFCEENTSTKKNNKRMPCPRRKKYSESERCDQDFSSFIEPSTVVGVEAFSGHTNTSKKKDKDKARAAKKKSGGVDETLDACVSQPQEVQEAIDADDYIPLSLWVLKLNRRKSKPACEDGQCVMSPVEKRQLTPELVSRREKSFPQVEAPESWELDGPSDSQASCSDHSSTEMVSAASISQQNISINPRNESHSEEIPGAVDGDDAALASKEIPEKVVEGVLTPCPSNKRKRKRRRRFGLSDTEDVLEAIDREDAALDGDDAALASKEIPHKPVEDVPIPFLNKERERKKRRRLVLSDTEDILEAVDREYVAMDGDDAALASKEIPEKPVEDVPTPFPSKRRRRFGFRDTEDILEAEDREEVAIDGDDVAIASKEILENVVEDVLIPFPSTKRKRKRSRRLGLSDTEDILEAIDREDVPLAYILNRRAKKT